MWFSAGSIAGDHSGTKGACDFVFSQKKHKNEVQNPEARGIYMLLIKLLEDLYRYLAI